MDTTVTREVVIESSNKNETIVLVGKCLMCGDCCILMCKMPFMLNEKGVCRFLGEDKLCDIQAGRVVPTDEQYAYWEKNCKTFPLYLSSQNYEALKQGMIDLDWPTENCGFTKEVLDG